MHKKFYHASIILWLGGLSLLIVLDYTTRLVTENYTGLGMNVTVWFLLQILLGMASLGLLVQAVKPMPTHKVM